MDIMIVGENPICRWILVNFFQRVTLFLLQTSLCIILREEKFPRALTHIGQLAKLLTLRYGSGL